MTARSPMRWLAWLGAALVLLTGLALLLDLPASAGDDHVVRIHMLVGLLAIASVAYLVATRVVLRHTLAPSALWLVLAVAVLLRLLLLTQPPLLSSDIYRYVWDGRVQAAGINPYRYVPADPALAPLRDPVVYPQINRADYARTIYPPVAQIIFAAVGRVWGSVTGMRLAMLGFEALGIMCMLRLLSVAGLPRERVLIYAWNPLALWSIASDGHVDAIAIGFFGLALLLRGRRRYGWAGAALAGAVMAKFFPLVVAPALLRGGRFWSPTLAGLAVIAGGYCLYLGAGAHVLGFLPSYGQEEGLASGGGIWLLAGLAKLMPLPAAAPAVYVTVACLLLLGLSVAILRQPEAANDVIGLCRDAGALAALAMVLVSPHYHWYFAWLAIPAVVAPSRALLWLATAPVLLIDDPIPDDRFLWPAIVYVPTFLLLLADRHRRRSRTIPPTLGFGVPPCP